jgi:hypothetical protein
VYLNFNAFRDGIDKTSAISWNTKSNDAVAAAMEEAREIVQPMVVKWTRFDKVLAKALKYQEKYQKDARGKLTINTEVEDRPRRRARVQMDPSSPVPEEADD